MQRSFETVARTSGNYTLTAADEYLGVGTREAPLTITLPSRLAVRPGYSFFIKDESAQASAFPITIQAVGGEEIEGASSYVMNVDGGFIEITNNSARFLVLGSHVSSVLGIDAGGTDADTAEEAVDNLGLDVKAPVRVAAKENIDITAFPLSVNSETLIAGDSVLLWLQTDPVENGVYEVITPGSGTDGEWERRADFNAASEIRAGVRIQALEGGSYAGIYFQVISNNPVVDTDPIDIQPLNDAVAVYDPYGEKVFGYNYVSGAENFVRVESGTTKAAPVVRGYSDVNDHVSMQLAGKGFGKVFQLSTIEILDQVPNDTAGDVTYSANAILGGLQVRNPNGAARIDTIPSATDILAQIPQHFPNISFRLKIRNEGASGETVTLAASTGITLVGDCVIQPETTREFFFHVTSVTIMGGTDAITVYDLYPAEGTPGYGAGAGLVVSGSDLAVDVGQGLAFSGNQVYIDTVLPGNLKATITNRTGSTLTYGTAVAMRVNSDGTFGAIPADATTGVIATHVVSGSSIPNDSSGTIVNQIVFGSIDTSTAAGVNSPLYLGVAGAYTFDAEPSAASDLVQVVGRVMVKDATEGVIALQAEPPIRYGTTNLQDDSVTAAKIGATFTLTFESENLITPGSRLYTGTVTVVTGAPVSGATLVQATSGATATVTAVNGNGSFNVNTVTGTWDATNLATGTNPDTTTFTFTPVETLIDTWLITESPLAITSVTSNDGTILPMKSANALLAANQARYQPTIPAPLSPIETLASDGWTTLDIDFASRVVTIA